MNIKDAQADKSPQPASSSRKRASQGPSAASAMKLLTYATLAGSQFTRALARTTPTETTHPLSPLLRRHHAPKRMFESTTTIMDSAGALAGQCVRDGSRNKAAYQTTMIEETEVFRGTKFYVSNNHTFLGPWTEERFFDHWQETQPKVERLFIPIGWTGSEIINRDEWKRVNNWAMNFYLNSLDKDLNYFTVIQIAKGFENDFKVTVDIPKDLNLTVFGTGPTTASQIVPIPLLKEEMTPRNLTKDLSVSFTGTFAAHPSREAMRDMYGNKEGWVFEEPHANWIETAERSRFVLCPRGWGVTSFRMYETLQLGSIPIYVHDDAGAWLPYPELVDWKDISVVIHEKDLPKLGEIIDNLDATNKTSKMLAKVNELRPMWTYDFLNKYIVNTLKRE